MLDEATVNRAAPPGSMRYFSLLYTPESKRAAVAALYVIAAEIGDSARSASHDVAHTRLQWWRAEIDRLVNGSPQHPATRALNAGHPRNASFAKLHEALAAADMDLARMTYANARELRAYSARSGGAIAELIAEVSSAPTAIGDADRALAQRLGVGVRQSEMVRDLRQDAHDGRIYLPLDEMEAHGLTQAQLDAREHEPGVKAALKAWSERIRPDLHIERGMQPAALRPLVVLAGLHSKLLDRIAARNYDVAAERVELGPVEKPWAAWRAARRCG